MTKLVLMGGVPSSGSTVISEYLNAHPDIFCGKETNLFAHPVSVSTHFPKGISDYPKMSHGLFENGDTWALPNWSALNDYPFNRQFIETAITENGIPYYLPQLTAQFHSQSVWVEKSPPNIFSIPYYLAEDSSRQAIITVRNPTDCMASLMRRGNSRELAFLRWFIKSSLIFEITRKFPGQVYVCKYEDFCGDPQMVLNEVFAFLGVEQVSLSVLARTIERAYRYHDVIDSEIFSQWRVAPNEPIKQTALQDNSFISNVNLYFPVGITVRNFFPTEYQHDIDRIYVEDICRLFGYKLQSLPLILSKVISPFSRLIIKMLFKRRGGSGAMYKYYLDILMK